MIQYLFTQTPLVFFTQNLWRDEAFSYMMSSQSIVDILKTTVVDFNPPFYYIVLHFWMKIFGTSEVSMRSLSFIFFAGLIFLLHEIMADILKINSKRMYLYLLLIIINPMLLSYAFEARMYMMTMFFTTLSYFFLWKKKQKLYGLSMSFALYSHYFSVFVLMAQILKTLIENIIKNKSKQKNRKYFIKILASLKIYLAPIVAFFPWLLYLLANHNFSSGDFWIIKPALKEIIHLPFVLYTGYERVFGEYYHGKAGYTDFHNKMNILLIFLILIAVFYSLMRLFASKKKTSLPIKIPKENYNMLDIYLLTFFPPTLIFIISQITTPLYHPRYFAYSSVGLVLIVIISLELIYLLANLNCVFKNLQKINPKILYTLVFAILFITTCRFDKLNLKYRSKTNVSEMYKEIKSLKKDGDIIILTQDMDYPLAVYYTGLDGIKISKDYDLIPDYVGKVLIPKDVTAISVPTYPKKAFKVHYDEFTIESKF